MDKRIKELAEQAGLMCTEDVNADGAAGILLWFKKFDLERFADLVRQDEREACARLCDDVDTPDGWSTSSLSASIRARGNHESLFDN